MTARLTVIVCTYNRSGILEGCLDSISKQVRGKDINVIIVDNNSTDATQEIISGYCQANPAWKSVFEKTQGLSHARNTGFSAAATEYVAYIDDDARLDDDWATIALDVIEREQPDIFGGPVYPVMNDDFPSWFRKEYGVRGKMEHSGIITKGFIVGTNIVFRKSLLEQYGGFSTEAGMVGNQIGYHEETLIVNRALEEGKKVYYSDELNVKDAIPDYKKSILFYMYSKYKSGLDAENMWAKEGGLGAIYSIVDDLDEIMRELNTALLSRGDDYEYPENYLVERVLPGFYILGAKVRNYRECSESFDHARDVKVRELLDIERTWAYSALRAWMRTRKTLGNAKRKIVRILLRK